MNVNWQDVILALKISGIGLVVLLLVLAALSGLISLLTRFIKDSSEEEEGEDTDDYAVEEVSSVATDSDTNIGKIAALAVAIARSNAGISANTESSSSALNSWGQFHLNRRLNLSSSFRRSK